MSERTLKRVLVMLGALVLVYGVVRLGAYATRPRGDSGGTLGATLDRLRKDTLTAVAVVAPTGDRVEVKHAATGWNANGFRADSSAVDRLVRAVREAAVNDLVAQSASTHPRLGVSSDSAWTATLHAGRDSVTLLVGHAGPEYGVTYVRLPGADAVYEVRGGLREALAVPLGDWRDKTIVRADTAAVHTLVLQRDGKSARLERAGKAWQASAARSGTTVDSTRVAGLLSELAHLDAAGFPADSATLAGRQRRRVVALGAKGDTLAAIELAGDSTAWLARSGAGTQLYRVAPYGADRLVPNVDSLVRAGAGRR